MAVEHEIVPTGPCPDTVTLMDSLSLIHTHASTEKAATLLACSDEGF